jgi:ATP-dependent Clp protease ATP-binding subunit ClpA
MGARPLGRKIDELIRIPLSKKILFDGLKNTGISADLVDDQIVFVIDSVPCEIGAGPAVDVGGVDA